jgi:hypothetical protein
MDKDSNSGARQPQWHVQKSDGAPSQRHAHSSIVWKDALFILGGTASSIMKREAQDRKKSKNSFFAISKFWVFFVSQLIFWDATLIFDPLFMFHKLFSKDKLI